MAGRPAQSLLSPFGQSFVSAHPDFSASPWASCPWGLNYSQGRWGHVEQGERRPLQKNGRCHRNSGAWPVQNWRWLFPYLRAVHITLRMRPPIPISNPGESPGLSEAWLTRRERLEVGTNPEGQVKEGGRPEDIIFSLTCWQGELNCSGWRGRQHQKQIWMLQGGWEIFSHSQSRPTTVQAAFEDGELSIVRVFNKAWVTIWQSYNGEDSYNIELAEADGLWGLFQYWTLIFEIVEWIKTEWLLSTLLVELRLIC